VHIRLLQQRFNLSLALSAHQMMVMKVKKVWTGGKIDAVVRSSTISGHNIKDLPT